MNFNKQRGFSLVELMVSITIGLILLAGVLSIFFSSRSRISTNEKTARLQENGRVALDLVTHDVRSAGYQGCARGVPFNNRPQYSDLTVLELHRSRCRASNPMARARCTPRSLRVTLNPAPVS